jgi:hypothetical protein
VTRPKEYPEQLAFLVAEGTKDGIKKARGDQPQADFLRDAIDQHIRRGLKRRSAVEEQLARKEKGE